MHPGPARLAGRHHAGIAMGGGGELR
jgi:hypothetical protein